MTLTSQPSTLPSGYTLQPGLFPPVPEYRNLRKSSGLTPVSEAQAAGAIKGSWYGCYISYTPPEAAPDTMPTAVAMGRVIGDGGWYFLVADMATLPEHQRKGLGDVVLKHLLAYVKEHAPSDGIGPYVTLFADPPGVKLYTKNGFEDAAAHKELGMCWVPKKRESPPA